MHNDLIEGHKRKLSPEARALIEEIERAEEMAAPDAPGSEAIELIAGRFTSLSERDRAAVRAIAAAKAPQFGRKEEEASREGDEMRQAESFFRRAQSLDRAEGEPVKDDMTLDEAVERLREAGLLSEEDERYVEEIMDKVVEVPVIEKIEHQEAKTPVDSDTRFEDLPVEVQQDLKLSRWLDDHYRNSMLIAAAAVLASSGSLDKVASHLHWTRFEVPAYYFCEDEEDELWGEEEDKLRLWVEREQYAIRRIIGAQAFRLAAKGYRY